LKPLISNAYAAEEDIFIPPVTFITLVPAPITFNELDTNTAEPESIQKVVLLCVFDRPEPTANTMSCANAKLPVSLNLPKNADPPFVPALCEAETCRLLPYAIVEIKLALDDETADDDTLILTPPSKLFVIFLVTLLDCEPEANIVCDEPKNALPPTVSVLLVIDELTALLMVTCALLILVA